MPVELVLGILCVSQFTLGSLSHSATEETKTGCMLWSTSEGKTGVCCDECFPGNRLVKACGPDPKRLCVPCKNGSYTTDPKADVCLWCTECVGGAQVLKKACTPTKDTECGCKTGLRCGDVKCTFCVKECGKGQEPNQARSCNDCSKGYFNDQIHAKCKPWRTSCPNPGEEIVGLGDSVSDSMCGAVGTVKPEVFTLPTKRGNSEDDRGMVLALTFTCAFGTLIIFFLLITKLKWKTTPKQPTVTEKTLIEPAPPTDDPSTLIDVSFHQPQQEQGSSSESLHSQDSETKLLNV